MRCGRWDVSVLGCRSSATHPGHLPAQLSLGACPSTRATGVSRQLLARAWAAGAGPGDSPLTIDLDSTICETYGLAKEGARHDGYTGERGPPAAGHCRRHRLLVPSARAGPTPPAAAAHFLQTVGRLALLQHSSRCGPTAASMATLSFPAGGWMSASPSPSANASLRDLIEAIPEEDWTPIPYWMDGAADVAETTYTPFQTKPDAAPVRLIVRRVKPTPGSQLALFAR